MSAKCWAPCFVLEKQRRGLRVFAGGTSSALEEPHTMGQFMHQNVNPVKGGV